MFVSMAVSLFTVRIIWQALGLDNYGIYVVVGGFVLMFQFLQGAMVAASQRFLAFELGTQNFEKLKHIFSNLITVHFLLALFVGLIGETIGLWFVNNELNIPPGREIAANWVYQCSLLAFIVTIISVPYNSAIVAHEHMKAFGYLGVLEVFLKLGVAYALFIIPGDKLIAYAFMILGVQVIMRLIYSFYCIKHFNECNFKYQIDFSSIISIFSFAGWSLLGNLGFSFRTQGLNIILNMFFNVAVNAAKGIANQVSSAIYGLTTNFQMALNPQIIKRFAANDINSMIELIFTGSRFSYFLLMLVTIPLFICDYILHLWLGEVAPYTVFFTQLILIQLMIDSLAGPLVTGMQAVGKIRNFQIVISILMLSSLPIAWIWLKLVHNPYIVLYTSIITSFIGVIARLILFHNMIEFSYMKYLKNVIFRVIIPSVISFIILYFIYQILLMDFFKFCIFIFMSLIISSVVILIFGCTNKERNKIYSVINKKINKYTFLYSY